jgi:hypothetical protein
MASTGPAGRHVPPWSISGELSGLVRDRVMGVWRWREFTIPLGSVYLAGAEGGAAAASGIVLILAVLVLAVALVRPGLLTRAVRRCLKRSRTHRWQRRWPSICRGLHWYRKLEEGGLLIPELLTWRMDRDRITIALRPLAEQTASSWDQMADALRRHVGGATVEWRESHGTLRVVVGRVGLPDLLPWQAHGAPEGQLVLGRRHGGGPLVIDALTTPHVLLAGATGSGKGGTIRAASAAALAAGWSLVILDPKEAGEYAWLELLGVPVPTTLREQVAALEELERVRKNRQAAIKLRGVDGLSDLPGETQQVWRPVLLVVDEAADLLVATKGKSEQDRVRAALQHKAGGLIVELARKGRSAGIHLLVAIQRPDIAQLGDQGGALRNNLAARLALGRLDADGLRMLGISATDPGALALDGTQGRGVCVGFAGDPRPSACQVAWLDQDRARAEVTPTWMQGLHFIGPQSAGEGSEQAEEAAPLRVVR